MKLQDKCDLDKDLENEDYKEYADYEICPVCEKRTIEFGKGRCQHCMSDLYKKFDEVLRANFTKEDIEDIQNDLEDKLLTADEILESVY